MNDEKIEFLPLDVYSFLDKELVVRSNSRDILEHLRSMYSRFYIGPDEDPSSRQAVWEDIQKPGMQIIDKLSDSNKMLVNDRHFSYRLSEENGRDFFTSQDLATGADDLSGFCDAFTLIQASLLKTVDILASDHHLIHAGVVAHGNNATIFPATSGMGKTTLVLKLISSGCRFLSDEVACFHPDRKMVEPFPRKLNIRSDSEERLGLPLAKIAGVDSTGSDDFEWMLDIEEIIPESLADRCQPRHIIFLRGFGEKPRLEFVSSSNASFELLNSSIGPIENPGSMLFRFAPILNEVECYNLVMGDLDETVTLIMRLLDEGNSRDG